MRNHTRMTQKLSATARRDKAARDKAYAMTPARKAKKAHAEREARANPSEAKNKTMITKIRDGNHLNKTEVTMVQVQRKNLTTTTQLNNMARISTYPLDGTIASTDKLLGTDENNVTTKNFQIQNITTYINTQTVTEHADNAAAIAAGLPVGTRYRTGDFLKIVH